MTPEQLAMVRRTAVDMERAGDEFGRRFYDHLFEIHPSARGLFPDDLEPQRVRLVDEILLLATMVGDLPAFLERARELGGRHQRDGVHSADYPYVGEALVTAVAGIIGACWSAQAESAWRRMYCLICEAMLEGAARGLFLGPR